MISKELFKNVYNYDFGMSSYNTELILEDDFPISLNDVAHKCKEWAFNNGYSMLIDIISKTDFQITMENLETGNNCYNEDFCNHTEPESIFKACQYILDNINDKGKK